MVTGLTVSVLVRHACALPALVWSNVYALEAFRGMSCVDALRFLRDLRCGISPLFAVLEMADLFLCHSVDFSCGVLYRAIWVTAFVLPVAMAWRSRGRTVLVSVISVCLAPAAIRIHQTTNAFAYDLAYPVFFLVFLLCLDGVRRIKRDVLRGLLAALSGTALALLDLSRPFVVFLLPFLVAFALMHLRWHCPSRRFWLVFLLPLVLLAGSWHAKSVWFNNGQLVWSNYTGCNLFRGWADLVDEKDRPSLLDENPDLVPSNSEALSRQSAELRSVVIRSVAKQPFRALGYAAHKLAIFASPRTQMYPNPPPEGREIPVYRVTVRALFFLFVTLCIRWLISVRRALSVGVPVSEVVGTDAALMAFTLATVTIMAIGEAGEEARFVLSVLPLMLACVARLPLGDFHRGPD